MSCAISLTQLPALGAWCSSVKRAAPGLGAVQTGRAAFRWSLEHSRLCLRGRSRWVPAAARSVLAGQLPPLRLRGTGAAGLLTRASAGEPPWYVVPSDGAAELQTEVKCSRGCKAHPESSSGELCCLSPADRLPRHLAAILRQELNLGSWKSEIKKFVLKVLLRNCFLNICKELILFLRRYLDSSVCLLLKSIFSHCLLCQWKAERQKITQKCTEKRGRSYKQIWLDNHWKWKNNKWTEMELFNYIYSVSTHSVSNSFGELFCICEGKIFYTSVRGNTVGLVLMKSLTHACYPNKQEQHQWCVFRSYSLYTNRWKICWNLGSFCGFLEWFIWSTSRCLIC